MSEVEDSIGYNNPQDYEIKEELIEWQRDLFNHIIEYYKDKVKEMEGR